MSWQSRLDDCNSRLSHRKPQLGVFFCPLRRPSGENVLFLSVRSTLDFKDVAGDHGLGSCAESCNPTPDWVEKGPCVHKISRTSPETEDLEVVRLHVIQPLVGQKNRRKTTPAARDTCEFSGVVRGLTEGLLFPVPAPNSSNQRLLRIGIKVRNRWHQPNCIAGRHITMAQHGYAKVPVLWTI